MIDAFLDWLRPNMTVLGWLGSGIVVLAGGIWSVWKHFDAKKKPSLAPTPGPSPTVAISVHGNTSTPPRELLIREGRNTLQSIPDAERIEVIAFSIFMYGFLVAMIFILRQLLDAPWQTIAFTLVLLTIVGYWFWLIASTLLHQLATMVGKARVVATDEFLLLRLCCFRARIQSSRWPKTGVLMGSSLFIGLKAPRSSCRHCRPRFERILSPF